LKRTLDNWLAPSPASAVGTERGLKLAPLGATLALSATWLHYAWSGGLKLQVWPRTANVVVPSAAAGLALVLLGWCCVNVYRGATRADLKRVLLTSLLVHVILLAALPLSSTDLFSYLAYGELAAHGMDMKLGGSALLPGSAFGRLAQWQTTPSVYGPLADLLMSAAGHVGAWLDSPVWGAGVTYKLIVGMLDLAGIYGVYRLARRGDTTPSGFALFGLNPLLAWEVAAQAHNDGFIVAGAVAYLLALSHKRETLGVASLMFGVLSKFLLAPTVGLHLWATLRNNVKRAVALSLLLLVILVAFCAPRWTPGATLATWLPQLRPGVYPAYAAATSVFSTLWRTLEVTVHPSEGTHAALYSAYGWLGRMALLGMLALLLPRVRNTADVPKASLLVLLVLLATAPTYAPWYVTWILPFAAVVTERRWQLLALGMTVVAAPALSVPLLWFVLPLSQLAASWALLRWTREPRPSAETALEAT